MATDGPDPEPCNPDVFKSGDYVGWLHGPGSNAIERWVKALAEKTGQRIDWHFVGGRARVLALGDVNAAREAFEAAIPELKAQWPELVWL